MVELDDGVISSLLLLNQPIKHREKKCKASFQI